MNESTNCPIPKFALNPREAAESLSLSERKLWELTQSGEIPCFRIGRSVRYSTEQLRVWVESQRADTGLADETAVV